MSYDFCFPRFPQSLNVDQVRSQFLTSSDFGERVGGMVKNARASDWPGTEFRADY